MTNDSGTIPDDPLGAFCRVNHVALTHTRDGLLAGTTFGAKDVFDIAGTRTGFGNPDWLASHPPARETAAVVAALLGSGADLLGRTLTDELTYSLTGENHHYGTPVNPAAPDRIPGGSSNGSASAVAGALVDFAIGTDCGGSVRLPASYCGILGMRPTHGRVSVNGVIPFAPTFDVVGWFARDASLLERVGAVLLGDASATTLPRRLIVARDAIDLVADDVRSAFEAGLEPIAKLVTQRDERVVSPAGLQHWFEVFRIVQGAEIWSQRSAWIASVGPTIGPGVRERIEWASTIAAEDAAAARAEQAAIRNALHSLLADGEILCLPTSPRVAPLRSEPASTLENEYRAQAMCLLCIAGLGGLPQLSLPLATIGGLPLGVSLVGAPGSDMQLLALASRVLAEDRAGP